MKKTSLALGMGLLFASGAAFAQSCTSAGVLHNGQVTSGTTCGAGNQVGFWCGSTTPVGSAEDVAYTVNLAAVNSPSITATAGFPNLYIGLASGACAEASACASDSEAVAGAAGEAATITLPQQPSGTYYLLVTALGSDCGTFSIDPISGLPVTLQQFSVE